MNCVRPGMGCCFIFQFTIIKIIIFVITDNREAQLSYTNHYPKIRVIVCSLVMIHIVYVL